ncbi:MAG: hypothetical protein K6B44_07045 [Lachnospiraceae bacterium]|nr:hypothetical protein [Lachnospiraceae bacterium]
MVENGVFKSIKDQQFREADADGYIGMKAYLEYFQDAASGYMHAYDWDNITVHEKYGVGWLLLKYHMIMYSRTLYENKLDIECWIEKNRHPAAIIFNLQIREKGKLLAEGRLESCLMDMSSGRIARPEVIGFDKELALDRKVENAEFTRFSADADGAEPVYEHVVRYSDLDNNDHVNNLNYMPMMQNAFDAAFYKEHVLQEMEIQYKKQCVYGETLKICKKKEEDSYRVLVVKEDGSVAAVALMKFGRKA